MFFSIAWRNAKRSRSENLIYFLTMVTAIATFYIVLSLGEQDVMRFLSELESDAVDRLLTKLLPTVYLCALLFVFSLVIFANKYQLECRSRELGLYLLFGMTKPRLFIQIMAEGLISSLLALLGGLICGGFLSEISSLATARLVGYGIIAHQSSFSIRAVILTTLGFLIIQSVALFVLCGKLFNKEIQQMLYGEMEKKQRTGSKSGNWLSLILGAVVLIFAYWIVLKHFMTAGNALIIVAVVFGIVGTVLSIRGLARLLSAAAASIKRKATSGLYIFTLRQLYENVVHKYISVSVASILIMLTIMLITDGSVSIMSYGKQITRGSSVYDFTVMGDERLVDEYLSNEKMNSYVTALNRMETGTMKHPVSGEMKSLVDWSGLREQVVLNLPPDVQDPVVQGAVSYEFGSHQPAALILLGFIDTIGAAPHLLPVSSYNRLLEAAGEEPATIRNDEAIFYLNPDFTGNTQDEMFSIGIFLQVVPITFLVGLVYAIYRLVKIRKRELSVSWGAEIMRWLFVCYLTGLINLVLVPRNFWTYIWFYLYNGYSGGELDPLFSGNFNLVPTFLKAQTGEFTIGRWVRTMLEGNLIIFLPMGFFLPFVSKTINTRNIFAFAVITPIAIELLQPVIGRSFDVDDVMMNFAGIIIGYFITLGIKATVAKR
jgi:putative ABC transport system permease protein